ncbi:hypothetical protein BY458DRAFT_548404 [Sporodiniella umbellata]|nr:hypothetical protein BY458DRAFT_548404 [Sporodiniella umbellata]
MACTLSDRSHGTVAEYKGDLVTVEASDTSALTIIKDNNMPIYPSIKFQEVENHTPHYVSVVDFIEEYAYDKLVNVVQSKLQKGLEALQTYPTYEKIRCFYDYINRLQTPPKAGIPRDIKINHTGIFKNISWHPHKEILAVATNTDDIYLYTKKESAWTCQVLSHKLMKDIRCIQWKKKAAGTLAVGCQSGVCVWTVDSHVSYKEGIRHHPSASTKFFKYQDCVTALAWDPSPGSQLLAVASSASGTLAIQDILLDETTFLKRQGKGNTLLKWSLDGKWLFVGGTSGKSRVWNTNDWTSKQLKNPPGLWVQTACWLPDNTTLLYSMKGKNDIHALCLFGPTLKQDILDVKIKSIEAPGVSASCTIKDISIDSRYGQRIAVSFENSTSVCLYNVQISPLNLRERTVFTSIGLLHGAEVEYESNGSLKVISMKDNAQPLQSAFSSFYKLGAILAIAWDNGTITFTTHAFKSPREYSSHFL